MLANNQQGRYAQIPYVMFDRCDLPEEIKWTFGTLYRQFAYATGGKYSGSYQKLAELLRLTKNKTYRMVKALESAHLLDVEENKELILNLKTAELWALNTLYEIGLDVPFWTDLPDALDTVLKIERHKGEYKSIDPDIVLNLVRNGLEIERILTPCGLKIEQIVLILERAKKALKELEKRDEQAKNDAPLNVNSITDINSKKTDAKASDRKRANAPVATRPRTTNQPSLFEEKKEEVELTPEERRVYDLYCSLWFIAVPPKITPGRKQHCATLAPSIKTQEDMNSLEKIARQYLKSRGRDVKVIELGNLVNSLNAWKAEHGKPEPEAAPEPAPDPEKTMVLWRRAEHVVKGPAIKNWWLYEQMPLAEALTLGYNPRRDPPNAEKNTILNNLRLLAEGKIQLPPEARAQVA